MPVEVKLPKQQFDTVVRWIKTCDADRLAQLRTILDTGMKALGLKPNPKASVVGPPPAGSDQFDAGSVRDWVARIGPKCRAAKQQVVALHATAVSRGG